VVTRPKLSFEQLIQELLTVDDPQHGQAVIGELAAKIQARKGRIKGKHLSAFETLAGCSPTDVITLLKASDLVTTRAYFQSHEGLARLLDQVQPSAGQDLYVSQHKDALVGTELEFVNATKPGDYLEGFRAFLEENKNALTALVVVTQRPRDLTRAQLRDLKLKLDEAGYSETAIRVAWSRVSNQDVAASIIGFIRQQALGSPLVPYDQRVDGALQRILASNTWTNPQKQWLERIGKQMKFETVVDRESLDRGQFKAQGGYERLNKVFDGKLDKVLGDFHEELWRDAG